MSPSRVSLILAISGWTLGLLNLVLVFVTSPIATTSPELALTFIEITPVLCYCILPAIWIVGVMLSANHALTLARAKERVPKSSVVALLLNLFGLAAMLIILLLTLMIAAQSP